LRNAIVTLATKLRSVAADIIHRKTLLHAKPTDLPTNGAKDASKTISSSTTYLENKRTTLQKIGNMTRKAVSVDTDQTNFFWELMPVAVEWRKLRDLQKLETEEPRAEDKPFPDFKATLRLIEDQIRQAQKHFDYSRVTYLQKEYEKVFRAQEEFERRRFTGGYVPIPIPYPPEKALKDPEKIPEKRIDELRCYWHLLNGKRASGRITFKAALEEKRAREGIQLYMADKTIGETLRGVVLSSSTFEFGYWADEQTFIKNDYTSFFPLDYSSKFKIASERRIATVGDRYFYEVRLQER